MSKATFIYHRCKNPQVLEAELSADAKRRVRRLQVRGSIQTADHRYDENEVQVYS
jgi:hypothetical protein